MGLHHVVLTTSKTSPEKTTLTLVAMQQLPQIEEMDSKIEIPCLKCQKWTIHNGRRKVCIIFKTDMDKLNIVVYRYRNNTYVKDTEMELKLTEYEKLLPKRAYLLSYIDVFFKRCIVLDETTVKIKVNFIKNGCSFPHERFPIVPGIENVIWTQ